jgi:hypothetical protein
MSNYYHTFKIQYLECPEDEPRGQTDVYPFTKGKVWVRFSAMNPETNCANYGNRELGIKEGDQTTWVCQHGRPCRATIVGHIRWDGPNSYDKRDKARRELGWTPRDTT